MLITGQDQCSEWHMPRMQVVTNRLLQMPWKMTIIGTSNAQNKQTNKQTKNKTKLGVISYKLKIFLHSQVS